MDSIKLFVSYSSSDLIFIFKMQPIFVSKANINTISMWVLPKQQPDK